MESRVYGSSEISLKGCLLLPLGDVVWSCNYFFVEKKNVKRILLFTAHESMKSDHMDEDMEDDRGIDIRSSYNEGEFGMEMLMEY